MTHSQFTLQTTRVAALVVAALWFAGCGRRPASPVCIGGSVLDGGRCVAQQAPVHHLPFREGYRTKVMQAFHGYVSHKNDLAYSVDLKCEEGDAVAASRDGRVWKLREDSNSGCSDPKCMDQANYVILDHGDGTYSEYYHLRHYGVLVEDGDKVCAGQVIAICGNTGYSTGPHLHYALTDLSRRTVPVQFEEGRAQQRFGFPVPDAYLTSENRSQARCKDPGYSEIPEDGFSHQGIMIDDPISMMIRDRAPMKISGRYYGDHPRIAIHRKTSKGGAWLDQCVKVDENGRFEMEVDWPLDRFSPGIYWLMLTGASDDCLAPGWAWSYKVRLR